MIARRGGEVYLHCLNGYGRTSGLFQQRPKAAAIVRNRNTAPALWAKDGK